MNVYFVKGMPTLVPTSRLKPVVPTVLNARTKILQECIGFVNSYRLTRKNTFLKILWK